MGSYVHHPIFGTLETFSVNLLNQYRVVNEAPFEENIFLDFSARSIPFYVFQLGSQFLTP